MKRLSFTIRQFQLNIDVFISKPGKHDASKTPTKGHHEAVPQTWVWTRHSQKRLPLTKHHFQLQIDIFTSKTGKHGAYHTLTDAYHETLSLPPPKNGYH